MIKQAFVHLFLHSCGILVLVGCGVSAPAQVSTPIQNAYSAPESTLMVSPTTIAPALNPFGQTAIAKSTAITERAAVARQTQIALGPTTPEPRPTIGATPIPANAHPLADGWFYVGMSSSEPKIMWNHLWRREGADRIVIVRVGGVRTPESAHDGVLQGLVEIGTRLPPIEPGWPMRPDPHGGFQKLLTPKRDGIASIIDARHVDGTTWLVIATEHGSVYVVDVDARTSRLLPQQLWLSVSHKPHGQEALVMVQVGGSLRSYA